MVNAGFRIRCSTPGGSPGDRHFEGYRKFGCGNETLILYPVILLQLSEYQLNLAWNLQPDLPHKSESPFAFGHQLL